MSFILRKMKLCLAFAIFFTCQVIEGFGFNNGVGYGLDHLSSSHRFYDAVLQDEFKLSIGSSFTSPGILLSAMSERVPVPVVRAMLSRYVSQHGYGFFLNPIIRGLHSRQDLTLSMLMFHQLGKAMENTILGRLDEKADYRTYTFLVDLICNCSFYYADEHDHQIKGFFVDILDEVCREAGKKCIVQHAPYKHCYVSGIHSDFKSAGVGILSRQFDGCVVTNNSEIMHAMALSDILMKYGGEARFFVPVGNPDNFIGNDIRGKTIGFLDGWYSNHRCLVENGIKGADTLSLNHMRSFGFPEDLPHGFEKNEIDAAFVSVWPGEERDYEIPGIMSGTPSELEMTDDVIRCADGIHLGVRKDSPVLEWFNSALRKMKKSGKYAEVCRQAQIEHGARGPVDCVL
ncbi:uncharacterized protein [Ptychodera flava]|uniref:uncharacterized protein n=1 Tax=Ptychodera flava TaxID=63121 RepID=UPI00396A3A25